MLVVTLKRSCDPLVEFSLRTYPCSSAAGNSLVNVVSGNLTIAL
jgi:hypothetical protein